MVKRLPGFSLPLQKIQAVVFEHAVKPGVERALRIKFLAPLERFDERILRQVASIVGVSCEPERNHVRVGHVQSDQFLERASVTLAPSVNEIAIYVFHEWSPGVCQRCVHDIPTRVRRVYSAREGYFFPGRSSLDDTSHTTICEI